MRISDWSSDVCSSDLKWDRRTLVRTVIGGTAANPSGRIAVLRRSRRSASDSLRQYRADWPFGAVRWIDAGADYIIEQDRKSVVLGKSVSVRVDLGGRRIITNKSNDNTTKESRK